MALLIGHSVPDTRPVFARVRAYRAASEMEPDTRHAGRARVGVAGTRLLAGPTGLSASPQVITSLLLHAATLAVLLPWLARAPAEKSANAGPAVAMIFTMGPPSAPAPAAAPLPRPSAPPPIAAPVPAVPQNPPAAPPPVLAVAQPPVPAAVPPPVPAAARPPIPATAAPPIPAVVPPPVSAVAPPPAPPPAVARAAPSLELPLPPVPPERVPPLRGRTAPPRPAAAPPANTAPAAPIVPAAPVTAPAAQAGDAGRFTPPRPVAGMASDRPPAYPEWARQRDEQGRVLVRVDVDASGAPRDVTVAESSGHAVLDEAAAAAVRRWRFIPAERDGRPVPAVADVPILFRMTN